MSSLILTKPQKRTVNTFKYPPPKDLRPKTIIRQNDKTCRSVSFRDIEVSTQSTFVQEGLYYYEIRIQKTNFL